MRRICNLFKPYRFPNATVLDSFEPVANTVQDVVWDGQNLISTEATGGLIYVHDGFSSTTTSSFSHPASTGNQNSLAFDGTNLISTDIVPGNIYVHSGITSTVSTSFSGRGNLTKITVANGNLISHNNVAGAHFAIHSGISATISSTFEDTIGMSVQAIAWDGKNLIVLDASSESVIILDGLSSTELRRFSLSSPAGACMRGKNLVVTDIPGGTRTIYLLGRR